jgi:hypothetical protein
VEEFGDVALNGGGVEGGGEALGVDADGKRGDACQGAVVLDTLWGAF